MVPEFESFARTQENFPPRLLRGALFLLLAGLSGSLAAAPLISGVNPSSTPAGGQGFILTVQGSGFMAQEAMNPISAGSEVYWNGNRLATTFVSEVQLTAAVPASFIASPGSAAITVVNPIMNGSNTVNLAIRAPTAPTPPLAITSAAALPAGAVDAVYSHTLAATGGTPPHRWSVRSGALPPGLNVEASSGAIAGVPRTAGTFPFEARVIDSREATSSQPFSLLVHPALAITTATLPGGVVGTNYAMTLGATGGLPPHRWSIRSGALPTGLRLDPPTGQLLGVPSAAGTFTFTIEAMDALETRVTRVFSLTIDPRTAINAVVNGASFLAGPLAPGTIVTIFGTELGPSTAALLRVGSTGVLETALGGTRVLFDSFAAALVYAQANQVSAIVPYGVGGRTSTEVTVEVQGVRSRPFSVAVAESAPALFTIDASGRGQGAILNQDYSLNGSRSPARKGSIVMLYATGGGLTEPVGVDGRLATDPLPRPRLPVAATVGGVPAEVLFAGGAPGLTAGVLQLNVAVPEGAEAGDEVPVSISIGNAVSRPGVTLAVR